ncbi:bifunctional diguanylate cyclase/phosphodiesterase [Erythrobacter sp. HL-111]|uniref:putative bifunctional diguanylate cyclase/phosphodiesterase n=1 Tax=Erythrobacter sp. HL-111 TaxID=1798193 RepID=UPI0006DA5C48|nr:EAL domain-containing protein [Erythrobacter sp. HL-111]KPP94963.1 MAG: diguanylate cyclase/phosphodiesterase [Erythrobacteraceae bacterium HL-111]SDS14646.1 diguanylate cyclase/phosphodiesterase [Erythrobacter sp. HL-111]
MNLTGPFARLLGLAPRQRADRVSARARRLLVKSLYTQPASLAIGALAGIAATGVSALVAGLPQLYLGASVLTLIAIARVLAALGLSPDSGRTSTFKLEIIYEIGAFSYALVIGLVGAMTLWLDAPGEVQVLMVANTLCYGVGVSARNAGRPSIAIGQLTLSLLPIMAACVMRGSLALITLAVTIALLIPAMMSIVLNISKVLRESIASADRSSLLADKMQLLARTDVVTGLANRAGLNHAMVETMMAIEEDARLALIWIDLDRFKEVNDLLGHPVGDRVLTEVARRLREVSPPEATVARFGGDEFVVFTPVDDRKMAERIASEIHAEIMRPVRIDGDRLEVRASLGVALLPDDGADADTLMQSADLALYHAKVGGRSQTRFFDSAMTRDLIRRREIEDELRAAIQREELSIFFQPIVDLESGRIRAFEALVRWFHPEKGELKPDEFIPVAEETGVIVTLGNWITAQAARTAATWPEDVTVAVNLSPLQIRAPGAVLGIRNALREAGLAPSRLELEVTESLFIEDNHATAAFIEELSAIGVKFALDDFGTGYSSLGHINTFPLHKIKVDRSFVSGAHVGRKSNAIIRAVAEMGSTLDIEIVAEGLETVEQVRAVREAGCTLGQGFYFSRAVPDYLAALLIAQEREGELGETAVRVRA